MNFLKIANLVRLGNTPKVLPTFQKAQLSSFTQIPKHSSNVIAIKPSRTLQSAFFSSKLKRLIVISLLSGQESSSKAFSIRSLIPTDSKKRSLMWKVLAAIALIDVSFFNEFMKNVKIFL